MVLCSDSQEALHDDRNAGPVRARRSWEGKFYLCQDTSARYSPWWPHLSQRRDGQEGYRYFLPRPLHRSPIRILPDWRAAKAGLPPSASPGDSCLCKADSQGTSPRSPLLLTPTGEPTLRQAFWNFSPFNSVHGSLFCANTGVLKHTSTGRGCPHKLQVTPCLFSQRAAPHLTPPSGPLPRHPTFFFSSFLKPLLLPSIFLQLVREI